MKKKITLSIISFFLFSQIQAADNYPLDNKVASTIGDRASPYGQLNELSQQNIFGSSPILGKIDSTGNPHGNETHIIRKKVDFIEKNETL